MGERQRAELLSFVLRKPENVALTNFMDADYRGIRVASERAQAGCRWGTIAEWPIAQHHRRFADAFANMKGNCARLASVVGSKSAGLSPSYPAGRGFVVLAADKLDVAAGLELAVPALPRVPLPIGPPP